MSNKLIEIAGLDANGIFEIKNLLGINRIKYYEINSSDIEWLGGIGLRAGPDAIYIKDKNQIKEARKLLWEYYKKNNCSNKNNYKKLI